MQKRHKVLWKIVRFFVIIFTYIKFGYRFKKAKNLPDNYIVLSNHTTDFDPLLVATSFKNDIRYVASEHIARWKYAYKFIKFVFDPIMIYKGSNAASTVKYIFRTLKNGTNVCMFAEGVRTWNGITSPIAESTGKVVKNSKVALVTYKISGGYFVSPLWSQNGTRRGKISGRVVNVYTAEQLSQMSVDEINRIIKNDLYEDAYETMSKSPTKYKGKQLAFRMESMLFACPVCKSLDTMHSHKDTVKCCKCNTQFTYNEYGTIDGIKQNNIKELFLWLKEKAIMDSKNNVTYCSENVSLVTISKHIENLMYQGPVSMNNKAITFGNNEILLEDICDMNMRGKYAVLLSTKDNYYEFKVTDGSSALKFYMYYLALNDMLDNRFSF